eukprot:Clim_evm40s214 gene=Clim_evmTU40s214
MDTLFMINGQPMAFRVPLRAEPEKQRAERSKIKELLQVHGGKLVKDHGNNVIELAHRNEAKVETGAVAFEYIYDAIKKKKRPSRRAYELMKPNNRAKKYSLRKEIEEVDEDEEDQTSAQDEGPIVNTPSKKRMSILEKDNQPKRSRLSLPPAGGETVAKVQSEDAEELARMAKVHGGERSALAKAINLPTGSDGHNTIRVGVESIMNTANAKNVDPAAVIYALYVMTGDLSDAYHYLGHGVGTRGQKPWQSEHDEILVAAIDSAPKKVRDIRDLIEIYGKSDVRARCLFLARDPDKAGLLRS